MTICYDEPLVCYDDSLYLYDGVLFTSQICPLEFEMVVQKELELEAVTGVEELVVCVLEDEEYELIVGGEVLLSACVSIVDLEICASTGLSIEACTQQELEMEACTNRDSLGWTLVALQGFAREAVTPAELEYEDTQGLTQFEMIGLRK